MKNSNLNLKEATNLIKSNRYSVSYMDGSFDAQNSGTEIFKTEAEAEKAFEKMSLDMDGNWSRRGEGQPSIYKELCRVDVVSEKKLAELQEEIEDGDVDSINKVLSEIHLSYASPIRREEYIWKNTWNEETLENDGEYELQIDRPRDFSTHAFSEGAIVLDSLESTIIAPKIK